MEFKSADSVLLGVNMLASGRSRKMGIVRDIVEGGGLPLVSSKYGEVLVCHSISNPGPGKACASPILLLCYNWPVL